MTAADAAEAPDRLVETERSAPPRVGRRLQLWGGGTAIVGTLLGIAPTLLFMLGTGRPDLLVQACVIGGGLLMVASAVLLATAFVGSRAPFGLAKLGGSLLILFHVWWLAAVIVPPAWLFGGPVAGEVWNATRLIIGVAAGIAIATSWPTRGFNRWSMLIVAACLGLAIYGAYALLLSVGQSGADWVFLVSYLQPLSLVAFGAGHVVSGWRGTHRID